MGADSKAITRGLVRAPSGLLQRLQRRVALEALGESGCSLGTEAVVSQTASRGVWPVVRSVNGRLQRGEHSGAGSRAKVRVPEHAWSQRLT